MVDFNKLRVKIFRNNRNKIIEFIKNKSSLESEWFNFELDAEFDEIIKNMNSNYRIIHDMYKNNNDMYNNIHYTYNNIYDGLTNKKIYYINIQNVEQSGNDGNNNTETEEDYYTETEEDAEDAEDA